MSKIYDFTVKRRDDSDFSLSEFKDKVLLIVNTATGCGFTPQYEGLEELYQKYHGEGLEILDFPCDQFGHQAPGTDDEIHQFCQAKYNTSFDQFKKLEVLGDKADPLFIYLCEQQSEEAVEGMKNKLAMKAIDKLTSADRPGHVRWNFTKFLVDRDGNVVARFAPTTNPKDFEAEIKNLL